MIRLYTLADRRPDFLPLQAQSIRKYLKDDHELVVLNNAIDNEQRFGEINRICSELGLRSITVSRDNKKKLIGGQRAFTFSGRYRSPNVACAYPIAWAWERIIDENSQGLFALIDSDMFFCNSVSLVDRVADCDAGVIMQHRGIDDSRRTASVSYFWNAFAIFKPSVIPHLKSLRWDCGVTRRSEINGHRVDVGGYSHYWLLRNKLELHHFAETAVYDFKKIGRDAYLIHLTYNGNLNIHFRFDSNSESIDGVELSETGRKKSSKWVFPHLPEHTTNDLVDTAAKMIKRYDVLQISYDQPVILGFIHSAGNRSTSTPFIIHHKAGSGYLGHPDVYLQKKLEFIKNCVNQGSI